MTNKIIFLNGCSSSGKTSLVKAIQHKSEEFWLTFGIDAVLKAMPSKYIAFGTKAEQGIQFLPSTDKEGFPVIEVKTGFYGEKISNSVPKIVKQLVDDGHNITIDEVIWERKDLENYAFALKNYQVFFVNVVCELPIMEEREILRGDRYLGLARAQWIKMKDLDWGYDLQVDTSQTSPFVNANKILKLIKSK